MSFIFIFCFGIILGEIFDFLVCEIPKVQNVECEKNFIIQGYAIKLLTGIIFIILFKRFEFSLDFIKYIVLFSVLIVSAFIDYNTQYVFFCVSVIGIISGVLFVIFDILNGEQIINVILSIIVPFIIIYTIMFITKRVKGIDGFGYGDIEIFLFLSLYLDLKLMILIMYLSVLLAGLVGIIRLIYHSNKKYVAFVPYILVATFITIIFHENIINYYLNLIK